MLKILYRHSFQLKKKGHWGYNYEVWEEPIKPLVRDVATIVLNGFQQITGDAGNIVLKENDNGNYEFHYFGYDFNGPNGDRNSIHSEAECARYQKYSLTEVCGI